MKSLPSIYNLARELGGSVGLAGMATLLTRYTNISRGALVEHVTIYDLATQQRLSMIAPALEAKGYDPASAQTAALQVLDRTVQAQASVLAFERVFILIGLVLVVGLPLLLLIRGPKGRPRAWRTEKRRNELRSEISGDGAAGVPRRVHRRPLSRAAAGRQ